MSSETTRTEQDCLEVSNKIIELIDLTFTPEQRLDILTQLLISAATFAHEKEPDNIVIVLNKETRSVDAMFDVKLSFDKSKRADG